MIFGTEKDFLIHMKEGLSHPVYLLFGEEDYLIDYYGKKMIEQEVPKDFLQFNQQTFDGASGIPMEKLLDSVAALPLMSPRKAVVVQSLNVEKLSATDMQVMDGMLADVPATTLLILSTKGHVFDKKKSAKAKKLIALVDKSGGVVELNARSPANLVKFIVSTAKGEGAAIGQDTARALIEWCGNDMRILKNETLKLAAHASGREITGQDVRLLAVPSLDAQVFDLFKVLSAGQRDEALDLLSRLFYNKVTAANILSVLSMSFVDIFRAKQASIMNVDSKRAIKELSYTGRDFRFRKGMSAERHYSDKCLHQVFELITDCDMQLKTSRADSRMLLEKLIVELDCLLREEVRVW